LLATGKPDFPFCFCWANETWEGRWHGIDNEKKVLIKQTYPSNYDVKMHFNYLIEFFKDDRYIKVDNKPIFQIYRPQDIPDEVFFFEIFNDLAIQNGFSGMHFIGGQKTPSDYVKNLDSKISSSFSEAFQIAKSEIYNIKDLINNNKFIFKIFNGKLFGWLPKITMERYDYLKFINVMNEIHISDLKSEIPIYPVLINDFDNTPRAGRQGIVLENTSPRNFEVHVDQTFKICSTRKNDNFVFIKSWNEWAEGNYLESDARFGSDYLEVLAQKIKKFE
jgi:hypothetical protein